MIGYAAFEYYMPISLCRSCVSAKKISVIRRSLSDREPEAERPVPGRETDKDTEGLFDYQ